MTAQHLTIPKVLDEWRQAAFGDGRIGHKSPIAFILAKISKPDGSS